LSALHRPKDGKQGEGAARVRGVRKEKSRCYSRHICSSFEEKKLESKIEGENAVAEKR